MVRDVFQTSARDGLGGLPRVVGHPLIVCRPDRLGEGLKTRSESVPPAVSGFKT
jgi:hypothetical protein